ADAIPLNLLKEEQERIGRLLRNIKDEIEAHESEHTEAAANFDLIFELLEDCPSCRFLARNAPNLHLFYGCRFK
ncbi:MAG: hypothetical protein FWD35_03690, partial [Oscillospiraceae bacterium]|nr:hypothetical protein [Oscillospiraceae bacterium]